MHMHSSFSSSYPIKTPTKHLFKTICLQYFSFNNSIKNYNLNLSLMYLGSCIEEQAKYHGSHPKAKWFSFCQELPMPTAPQMTTARVDQLNLCCNFAGNFNFCHFIHVTALPCSDG